MAVNYGSKRIVVGAHYGVRDWLSQRVTAVLMALFTLSPPLPEGEEGAQRGMRWEGEGTRCFNCQFRSPSREA